MAVSRNPLIERDPGARSRTGCNLLAVLTLGLFMATRSAARKRSRLNVAAERIDHGDGGERLTEGADGWRGTLQRQRTGLVSRFLTGSGLQLSAASSSIYPGGVECLDSPPEEFALTTTSLGERARHKLFSGQFAWYEAANSTEAP